MNGSGQWEAEEDPRSGKREREDRIFIPAMPLDSAGTSPYTFLSGLMVVRLLSVATPSTSAGSVCSLNLAHSFVSSN